MKHTDPHTLRGAIPLETRDASGGDEATLETAITAVTDLRTAFDTGMTAAEAKATETQKALEKRMAELETKLNRPGTMAAKPKDEDSELQKRAFNHMLRNGAEDMPVEMRATLVKGDDAKGGFLVHPDFEAQLTKDMLEVSPVRQVARVTTIGGPSLIVPTLASRPTAEWVTEIEERPETNPTFGQLTITPHEMACMVPVSNQLLEDSEINLEAEIRGLLTEEFSRLEGAAFIDGNGTGKPKGFMNGVATIPAVNSGAAAAITADSLIAMFYSMKAAYRSRGAWMLNSDALGKIRTLKDSQGAYLWREGISEGQPATILGRPVYDAADMPDTAANAFPIAFGDWMRGYRIVDRVGMSILRDPYTRASVGQTVFHARKRVGGAPTLAEALVKMKIATA